MLMLLLLIAAIVACVLLHGIRKDLRKPEATEPMPRMMGGIRLDDPAEKK